MRSLLALLLLACPVFAEDFSQRAKGYVPLTAAKRAAMHAQDREEGRRIR